MNFEYSEDDAKWLQQIDCGSWKGMLLTQPATRSVHIHPYLYADVDGSTFRVGEWKMKCVEVQNEAGVTLRDVTGDLAASCEQAMKEHRSDLVGYSDEKLEVYMVC